MFKHWMLPYLYMDEEGGGSSGTGEIDWSKIDWSTFDVSLLPEDVVKKTTAFTKVKDEAATRRQENTKLKKQIQTLTTPEENDTDEKPEDKPEQKPENKNDDIPEWAKQLQDSFKKMNDDKLADWRGEAAILYNIKSPKVAAGIEGSTRDEIMANAKKLAEDLGLPAPSPETTGINPNIIVGNPVQTRDKGFLERVKAEMYGQRGGKENPFSPNVQRAMGGGVVITDD